jgi:hypothetical protein
MATSLAVLPNRLFAALESIPLLPVSFRAALFRKYVLMEQCFPEVGRARW